MKHPFTQSELESFVNEGRTIVTKYRSAASIVWSHGTKELVLIPLREKAAGMPFTKRGRIQANTPEDFHKMMNF